MSSEFRLVPYQQSLNSCHRRQEVPGLSRFLSSGGQIRQMELGAQSGAPNADLERVGLLTPNELMERHYDKTQRTSRVMMCGVICTLIVATSVFFAIGVTVWRVNAQMEAMHASIAPHAENVINSTLQMLADTKSTLKNFHTVSDSGTNLATSTVPHLIEAVNNTASISDRIKELLKHPAIKLSLDG